MATPFTVTTQLQAGTNTLAIAASNGGSSPNAAGLIGKLILNYADGSQSNLLMDATWKTANTLPTNWQLPGFKDSSWTNALVLGSFGISPWGTGVSVQTGLPIFRREFTVGRRLAARVGLHLRPWRIRIDRQRRESGERAAVTRLDVNMIKPVFTTHWI